jgi:hypothetical protein
LALGLIAARIRTHPDLLDESWSWCAAVHPWARHGRCKNLDFLPDPHKLLDGAHRLAGPNTVAG